MSRSSSAESFARLRMRMVTSRITAPATTNTQISTTTPNAVFVALSQ